MGINFRVYVDVINQFKHVQPTSVRLQAGSGWKKGWSSDFSSVTKREVTIHNGIAHQHIVLQVWASPVQPPTSRPFRCWEHHSPPVFSEVVNDTRTREWRHSAGGEQRSRNGATVASVNDPCLCRWLRAKWMAIHVRTIVFGSRQINMINLILRSAICSAECPNCSKWTQWLTYKVLNIFLPLLS